MLYWGRVEITFKKKTGQTARERRTLGLCLDDEPEVQWGGRAFQRSPCQAWIPETQNACTLFSLRTRPLSLEGLEPQPSPPSHRHHQPRHAAGDFSVTPTLLPRTHVFQGTPSALPGGRLSPLGRGEPPGGRAMQEHCISF